MKNVRRAYAIFAPCLFSLFAVLLCLLLTAPAHAQTTVSTGSIQGTVTDPTGAVVPNAAVTITNSATKATILVRTTHTGVYASGALTPGNYLVSVSARGFKTTEMPLTVQVGVTSPGNVSLQVGATSTVVKVTATPIRVNTQQATVQNVLTLSQISNLPINGENYLALAQLSPGVQMQDGANFDPTKVGYSSISIAGQYGRTARIEVDGVDVSDETVGTVTENIPSSAIQEFSIEQSTLNPSTELTSSGAVNVDTRSGTNLYHGDLFGLFRNSKFGAAQPTPPPFEAPYSRSMFGGDVGGPILHNKLFFFADAQRNVQADVAPVPVAAPFSQYGGTFSAPYRETDLDGRLDYSAPHGMHLFYRFTYFKNIAVSTTGVGFEPFRDVNLTRQHVLGADFVTGDFTHSFRFSYLKFRNNLGDAVLGSSLPFANLPVSMQFADTGFSTGPNLLAPQGTPQSDHQFKYDGSWIRGNHILTYGLDFNHIQGGGFADFFGIDPTVITLASLGPVTGCAGGASDPTCYPILLAFVGNNQGFSTEQPAFGFPAGGLGPDNRLGVYLGDNWHLLHNLTITAALRWDRDTGRTDSDLNTLQAINNYLPGFGNPVQQANNDLAPQLGLAWDPTGSGKTSIRIGAGLFFENVIFNNVLFDRPLRLPKGTFLQFPLACAGGTAQPVPFGASGPYANQTVTVDQVEGTSGLCGDSIGQAASDLAAFEKAYQKSWAVPQALPNPSFAPTLVSQGFNVPTGLFAPGYKTPVSFQLNAGIQRQLAKGLVLGVNYLRNVNTHYLLSIDANHAGDAAYFNLNAAQQAIAATNAAYGCGPGIAGVSCAITASNNTLTMEDYAANGLTAAPDVGGTCQSVLGTAWPCAFQGINPNIGVVPFLFPVGRSVYNALMFNLRGNLANVAPGLHLLSLQFAYTLSKFTNDGSTDQAFVNTAFNERNPLAFTGYSSLDRTNMFSFGGYANVPWHFQLGFIGHFFSPLPLTMSVAPGSGGFSQMFQTGFTGSGIDANTFTGAAILPGTDSGAFGRTVSAGQLNSAINAYDNNAANAGCPAGMLGANCPTPAGQVLIQNGLFSLAQLQALGGVSPLVANAPTGENGLGWLKEVDFSLAWPYTIHERLTIKPSVSVYNAFNFANFDLPGEMLSGLLGSTQTACTVNGTVHGSSAYDCPTDRVGIGTGVFGNGAPRSIEFGLKLSF